MSTRWCWWARRRPNQLIPVTGDSPSIRADHRWADISVIIVTTEAEAQDRRRGFEAGADLYMVKPVEEPELVANIRMLIGEPRG